MELSCILNKILGVHNPWLCGSKRYTYGLDKRLGFIINKTPLLEEKIFRASKKLNSSNYRDLSHKLHRFYLMSVKVQISYSALLQQKRKVICSDLLTVHYNTQNTPAKDYSVDELSERLETAITVQKKLCELEKNLKASYGKESGFLSEFF